jgi:ABC-2 type transport system ATP-binding protein
MPSVLSLHDVTLCYGGFVAVDSLCLSVQRGEVFGLLGPNGCGKSTTLAAIVAAHAPTTGEIRIEGRLERQDPLGYRQRIGLVPQELALYEELTASENVSFFGRLYGLGGRKLRERVEEVLHFVRLAEHARRVVRTFSGGMQRRLNLACALVHEPALLLLDEPTVGLDIQSRDVIFASLRELCDRGTALVFTTHHLEEAELLCDRIGIMDHGKLIALGTLDELCAAFPAEVEQEPLSRWRLNAPHTLAEIAPRQAGLERVFLELTGRSLRET